MHGVQSQRECTGTPVSSPANSFLWEKNEWPPNSPDLKQFDYHVWARCWDTIRNTHQNRPTLPSWRLPCYRYGMIFHMSSLIRQSHHFERDFVCCCSWWTFWNQFKYREGSWHSSLKRLNCWRRSRVKFDSLLLNIPDGTACSLEKVNFKF